jgi:Protein of unknown function (DUF3617)
VKREFQPVMIARGAARIWAALKEDEMRKMILLGAVSLSATVLLMASGLQPLNLKPGLWETTMTTTISGLPPIPPDMQARLAQMPPEQRAKLEAMMKSRYGGTPQTRTYRSCVRKEGLDKYPFSDPDKKCTYNVLTSTGSKMDVRGTCMPGSEGAKIDFNYRLEALDPEHAKGTGQAAITSGGQTMNGIYSGTGKWIGASCPAGMK